MVVEALSCNRLLKKIHIDNTFEKYALYKIRSLLKAVIYFYRTAYLIDRNSLVENHLFYGKHET